MINYVALTLGLLGSMHCLVMCGPLIISVGRMSNKSGLGFVSYSLVYNSGRILAYVLLGAIFASFGQLFSLLGIQQIMSVLAGIFLIGLYLLSSDLEKFIFRHKVMTRVKSKYTTFLSDRLSKLAQTNPVYLGFLNGLLPCGMVYVAIAGAINSASIVGGVNFMFSFGIGTFPMLFGLMLGSRYLISLNRIRFNRVVSYGHLVLGVYLIWRGLMIETPSDLITG